LYDWLPRDVWELELFEALDCLDEAISRRAMDALMQAVAFLKPEALMAMVNDGESTLTLEDEFGAEDAAEMRAAQRATLRRIEQLKAEQHGN